MLSGGASGRVNTCGIAYRFRYTGRHKGSGFF
jgi:hypothetical protein